MDKRVFIVDNGKIQFKAILWKEYNAVCFQVLKQENIIETDKVEYYKYPELGKDGIFIRGEETEENFKVCSLGFNNDIERDNYFKNAVKWLNEFCEKNNKTEDDKFDTYDITKGSNGEFIYIDKNGKETSPFKTGMSLDNFAGIKYRGNVNWFMNRKVWEKGEVILDCDEESKYPILNVYNSVMAIPEKIRFFK